MITSVLKFRLSLSSTSCRINNYFESLVFQIIMHRNSRLQMFLKLRVLKYFAIFTGKHLCWSLLLMQLQALQTSRLQHRCFPVNIAKFLGHDKMILIKTTGIPEYLFDIIPHTSHLYNTCLAEDFTTCYSFFPSTIIEWNKLNKRIWQSITMLSFRNALLKIDWPTPKPVYNIHDLNGLKLLTRLRLGLNYLNEHKFNYNFKECVNPICSCSIFKYKF